MTRRWIGLAVAASCVACRPAIPVMPGQGGPAWHEVTSAYFTVWSDAAPDEVRALVARMERMRAILTFAAFPSAPAEGRGLAIVLRDDAELRAFTQTGEARPFAVRIEAPLWQPVIVLSASSQRAELERTLAHELTHAISFGVIHHQPRWFAEGMATYFQTAGLDPGRSTVMIGGSPTGERVDITRVLSIAELFEWSKITRDEGRQYVTAWALFFFLSNQHAAELQRFAQLLDAASEVELHTELVKRLWDQAFTTLPFAGVDRALHDWLFSGTSYALQALQVKARPVETTDRVLRDADVHAIRGLLRHVSGAKAAAVRAELAAALAGEPTLMLARVLAVAIDGTLPTVDEARALAAAHGDDWRAWLLLADALAAIDPHGAWAARVQACTLIAANPVLSPPPKLCAKLVGHSAAAVE